MDMDRIKNLIIGFTLVALIAASGAIALSNFQSSEKVKYTTSVTNESVTVSSGSGVLAQGTLYVSTSAVRNTTANALTASTNYNVSSTGTVTIVGTRYQTGTYYVDYTHYTPTYQMNITENGLMGIDNTTSYFGTAGTIAGVALLLTIVIGAFFFVTQKGRA